MTRDDPQKFDTEQLCNKLGGRMTERRLGFTGGSFDVPTCDLGDAVFTYGSTSMMDLSGGEANREKMAVWVETDDNPTAAFKTVDSVVEFDDFGNTNIEFMSWTEDGHGESIVLRER